MKLTKSVFTVPNSDAGLSMINNCQMSLWLQCSTQHLSHLQSTVVPPVVGQERKKVYLFHIPIDQACGNDLCLLWTLARARVDSLRKEMEKMSFKLMSSILFWHCHWNCNGNGQEGQHGQRQQNNQQHPSSSKRTWGDLQKSRRSTWIL